MSTLTVTLRHAIKLVAVTRSRHISRDPRSGILVGIGAAFLLAPVAAALCAGAGAVELATAAVTRYSAPIAAQDFLS